MCIRDSLDHFAVTSTDDQATMLEVTTTHLQREGCISERCDRVCFEPVSYTHLRAHETVLDLVCRLLLEKKHNNS